MTLQSRKKHRITVLSTLLSSAVAAGLAIGDVTSSQASDPTKSPLERLLQRSPEKDWEHLKSEAQRRREALDSERSKRLVRPVVPTTAPVLPERAAPEPEITPQRYEPSRTLGAGIIEASYQNATSDPKKLKSIKNILPYADYQPEGMVRTDIDPSLQKPEEVGLGNEPMSPRPMQATCFQWQASNIYHNPLYFEDPAFERYGHAWHPVVQPFASVGRFSVQLVGLPYQMAIDGPCKKMYPLGWYRPGDCAPKQIQQIPWNTKAALVEAGVITGAVFALP